MPVTESLWVMIMQYSRLRDGLAARHVGFLGRTEAPEAAAPEVEGCLYQIQRVVALEVQVLNGLANADIG